MDHLDQAGFNIHAAMTAVLPMAQAVYTGDEDGKVVCLLPITQWREMKRLTRLSSMSGIVYGGNDSRDSMGAQES